jgi:hypothetical protein
VGPPINAEHAKENSIYADMDRGSLVSPLNNLIKIKNHIKKVNIIPKL